VRSSALITGPMRALYQPPLASWLPDGAGTTEDMRQLHRATHRNEFAERAEFAWPNVVRNVDRGWHEGDSVRGQLRATSPESTALPYAQ
jgi:hypothetical protein